MLLELVVVSITAYKVTDLILSKKEKIDKEKRQQEMEDMIYQQMALNQELADRLARMQEPTEAQRRAMDDFIAKQG